MRRGAGDRARGAEEWRAEDPHLARVANKSAPQGSGERGRGARRDASTMTAGGRVGGGGARAAWKAQDPHVMCRLKSLEQIFGGQFKREIVGRNLTWL